MRTYEYLAAKKLQFPLFPLFFLTNQQFHPDTHGTCTSIVLFSSPCWHISNSGTHVAHAWFSEQFILRGHVLWLDNHKFLIFYHENLFRGKKKKWKKNRQYNLFWPFFMLVLHQCSLQHWHTKNRAYSLTVSILYMHATPTSTKSSHLHCHKYCRHFPIATTHETPKKLLTCASNWKSCYKIK